MSETKILSEYKTRINGVCVVFKDVPYTERWGSKVIKINFHSKELENQICLALLKHRPVITGGILKFIRHYVDLSMQDVASEYFNVTKATISDWESSGDKIIKTDRLVYAKVFNKLVSTYQARMLESILLTQENSGNLYNDANPLNLRMEEESYYEIAMG
jgi:DNA-binding transcriptional regulator YiaG